MRELFNDPSDVTLLAIGLICLVFLSALAWTVINSKGAYDPYADEEFIKRFNMSKEIDEKPKGDSKPVVLADEKTIVEKLVSFLSNNK